VIVAVPPPVITNDGLPVPPFETTAILELEYVK
jgi:hypothetical protein